MNSVVFSKNIQTGTQLAYAIFTRLSSKNASVFNVFLPGFLMVCIRACEKSPPFPSQFKTGGAYLCALFMMQCRFWQVSSCGYTTEFIFRGRPGKWTAAAAQGQGLVKGRRKTVLLVCALLYVFRLPPCIIMV